MTDESLTQKLVSFPAKQSPQEYALHRPSKPNRFILALKCAGLQLSSGETPGPDKRRFCTWWDGAGAPAIGLRRYRTPTKHSVGCWLDLTSWRQQPLDSIIADLSRFGKACQQDCYPRPFSGGGTLAESPENKLPHWDALKNS